MGRKLDVDLLVGTHEIAERLGLSTYYRVHDFRRRYADFPRPVRQLKNSLVWYWPEIEDWAKQRGRLPAKVSSDRSTSRHGSDRK